MSAPKESVLHFEQSRVRPLSTCRRENHQSLTVSFLETVSQHRAVDLLQQIRSDLDDVVRSDAANPTIEGRVVDLAAGQTVADRSNAGLIAVRDDVRRIKKLAMTQGAHRATGFISTENCCAKDRLMQTSLRLDRDVPLESLRYGTFDLQGATAHCIDHELELGLLFSGYVDRNSRCNDLDHTPGTDIAFHENYVRWR